jgi:hypothetical protein
MTWDIRISLYYNSTANGDDPLAIPERPDLGSSPHAQAVMRHYGITYEEAIPQSISDSWKFLGCDKVPDTMPKWMSAELSEERIKREQAWAMRPDDGKRETDNPLLDTNGVQVQEGDLISVGWGGFPPEPPRQCTAVIQLKGTRDQYWGMSNCANYLRGFDFTVVRAGERGK